MANALFSPFILHDNNVVRILKSLSMKEKASQNLFLATGIIALTASVVVFTGLTLLKHYFGYPQIIRATPDIILNKLYDTRHIVPYLYYIGVGGFGLCTLFFASLFGKILNHKGEEIWSSLGKICGIVSGVLLYTGIIRYSILFPKLSEMLHSEAYSQEFITFAFTTVNLYAGESIAEHAQFIFTALMMLFFGLSILCTRVLPGWLSVFSFLIFVVDLIGNLEHFGFKFAFWFNRLGPELLAGWYIIVGLFLIIRRNQAHYESIR
jgi:hypothetical protein